MADRFGFNPDLYPSAPQTDSCCPPNYPPQYPPPYPGQPHYPPPNPPHHDHFHPPPHRPHPDHFAPPHQPPHHDHFQPPHHHHSPPHHYSPPPHHKPIYPPYQPQPSYPSYPSYPTYTPPPPDGAYVARGYYWVDTTARKGVPSTAVHGGVDQDGTQIYVGRAHHDGDWIPAKVIPEKKVAYIAYDGKEIAKNEFQVLCEQRFEWIPSHAGNVPPGAVEGGKTKAGEVLYIGRAHHQGSQTVGKVHPSHKTCYISFGGKEIGYRDYEILVLRG